MVKHLRKAMRSVQGQQAWPSPSWSAQSTPQTYSYDPASSQSHVSYHSYSSQPGVSYQQPFTFDFSQFYPQQAAATATASAYASSAAQFAQQFAHQIATAPPVNAQVDQQNLEKYSQYLDILRNAYGIQLPGELSQKPQPQPEYQLSSYPTATATTYQAGASPYASAVQPSQPVAPSVAPSVQTYTSATSPPQSHSQYQVYQPQSSVYGAQQQLTYQNVARPVQPVSGYAQVSYPDSHTYTQTQQHVPQVQVQQQQVVNYATATTRPTYNTLPPAPTPSPTPRPHSYETAAQPNYGLSHGVSHPQYPPQTVQTGQYPGPLPPQPSQPAPAQPSYPVQPTLRPQPPPQAGDPYAQQGERYPPTYQNAAFSTYNGQSPSPKPQVYTYSGPGHAVKPTYSTNIASQYVSSAEHTGIDANSVAEPETVGSVYGGGNPPEPAVYTVQTAPPQTRPPTFPPTRPPPTTRTTTPRPATTRPRPTAPPTAPPTKPTTSTKAPEMAVSAQALTQQIRRLPAVLYLDSRVEGSAELETMLRDTYGLPLVAFYVDKLGRPQLAQKHLHQLTAHKGLPYLFICGTFIGSEQHIQNYHKNGQIPQLVEYVCGDERKKKKTKKTSS
ncbi:hypothetical protein Y032_0085g1824 [Ancylostoma ceylanicum]|uniref:Uncharacterized protein n=1 Tax=Ancylostoma ceylanicum TaxID=53326 RepID=A0A016TQX3_9BILA|nr:hypothetical protein Y032_0085g1824 [Ancylostoma ceylanicum]